jgi:hypothetical protein
MGDITVNLRLILARGLTVRISCAISWANGRCGTLKQYLFGTKVEGPLPFAR